MLQYNFYYNLSGGGEGRSALDTEGYRCWSCVSKCTYRQRKFRIGGPRDPKQHIEGYKTLQLTIFWLAADCSRC